MASSSAAMAYVLPSRSFLGGVAARRHGGTVTQSSSSSSHLSLPKKNNVLFGAGRKKTRRNVAAAAASASSGSAADKVVWIETTNVQVLLSAFELGLSTTALFNSQNAHLAKQWKKVGRFITLHVGDEGVIHSDADNEKSTAIGILCSVECAEVRGGLYKLNPVETHSLRAPGFNEAIKEKLVSSSSSSSS
jgi:hypothetical protein